MSKNMAVVRLARGEVAFFDPLTRAHLNIANPQAIIAAGMNTENIKTSVRSGRLILVSGSLEPETIKKDEPVKAQESRPTIQVKTEPVKTKEEGKPVAKQKEPVKEETVKAKEEAAVEEIKKETKVETEETAEEKAVFKKQDAKTYQGKKK